MKRFLKKSIKFIYYAMLVFWIMVTIICGLSVPKYVPSGDRAFYLITNLSMGLAFLLPLIIFGLAFNKTEKIKFFKGISFSAKVIRATILSAIVFALMMVVYGNVEALYSDELTNIIEENRKMYEQKEALAKEDEAAQNNDKQSEQALEVDNIKVEDDIEAVNNAQVEQNTDKPVVEEESNVSKQSVVTPQKTNNNTTQKNTETIKQEVPKKQPIKEEIKKEEPKKEEIKNETSVVSDDKKPSDSNTNSNDSSNSNADSIDKIYYVVIGNRYYHIKKDCKFIDGGSVESTSNISGKFACNCVKY